MPETKMSDEECAYNYLIGHVTSTLSSFNYLERYGLSGSKEIRGKGKKRKYYKMSTRVKKAVVVGEYVDRNSEWPRFVRDVDNTYSEKVKQFEKKGYDKSKATKSARTSIARSVKPGILVESYVPAEEGAHYFALRKDGLIGNGYCESVFNPAKGQSKLGCHSVLNPAKEKAGVGVGLGFQKDSSHGFCQTFAIMYLLISQKNIRNVYVNYYDKDFPRKKWDEVCRRWHKNIWLRLADSREDKTVIRKLQAWNKIRDVRPRVAESVVNEAAMQWEAANHVVYSRNGRLALQFISEFVKYCPWEWTPVTLLEACKETEVLSCSGFNDEFMIKLLDSLVETTASGRRITLDGILKYLLSKDQYFQSWFSDGF